MGQVLGVRQDTTKKGTTVTNNYQKNTPKTSAGPGLAVPDEVTVAMGEIVDDMREGLLALAVGAGLQVMSSLMEADVATACGPRGRHDPERTAVRHGSERGSVTLGGRRVGVQRPRMRATGGGEVPVPAYDLFSRSEILGRMAMSKMLGGLSSRRYAVGLEPVGEKVERAASATSKSAVSRRFVAMTETALCELLAAPLGNLDLVALMIDGVHFGEHLCVVALGIGIDGTKHPLGLVEGSTENTTVVTDLLTDLRGRGLDTTRPILVGIDGGKALHAAVTAACSALPPSMPTRIGRVVSSPRPRRSVSRSVTTVVFSVLPSTSPRGCLVPSMPIPSATTHRCSPKWTPSIINATRSSWPSGAASRSVRAVSVIATNLRETADLLVAEAARSTLSLIH